MTSSSSQRWTLNLVPHSRFLSFPPAVSIVIECVPHHQISMDARVSISFITIYLSHPVHIFLNWLPRNLCCYLAQVTAPLRFPSLIRYFLQLILDRLNLGYLKLKILFFFPLFGSIMLLVCGFCFPSISCLFELVVLRFGSDVVSSSSLRGSANLVGCICLIGTFMCVFVKF